MIEKFQGEHRFLSNFWPCTVRYRGLVFDSVEEAYQASKCVDIEDCKKFVGIGAGAAKKLGRTIEVRPDWNEVREAKMEIFCRQKFWPGSNLANLLEETGNQELVEGNHWNDTFWGVCRGKGDNRLGKILMKIRQRNRDELNDDGA